MRTHPMRWVVAGIGIALVAAAVARRVRRLGGSRCGAAEPTGATGTPAREEILEPAS